MASFYQDMSEEDVRSHNKRFIENFRKEFGHEPNIHDISVKLSAILEKKVEAFVEQNYSDFPPTVISKMSRILNHDFHKPPSVPIIDQSEAQAMPDYDQPEPEIPEVAPKEKKQKIKAKKK